MLQVVVGVVSEVGVVSSGKRGWVGVDLVHRPEPASAQRRPPVGTTHCLERLGKGRRGGSGECGRLESRAWKAEERRPRKIEGREGKRRNAGWRVGGRHWKLVGDVWWLAVEGCATHLEAFGRLNTARLQQPLEAQKSGRARAASLRRRREGGGRSKRSYEIGGCGVGHSGPDRIAGMVHWLRIVGAV